MKLSPSILTCDYARMDRAVVLAESAGAEWLHLDVMDGVFVPNLSFGPPVIKSLRPLTGMVFDVHLMMQYPDRLIDAFADAGADLINFHVESDAPIAETIAHIRRRGKKAGLTVKPNTPVETVFPYLDQLSLVLVMTVEPGFGGQAFMPQQLEKVTALQQECRARGLSPEIEVDGGVNAATAPQAAAAGATVAVVGSALINAPDPAALAAVIHAL